MKKVIGILGTGPAGLMAAHAAAMCGQPMAIFGLGEKSQIGGAQFLHKPIPGITDQEPDTVIRYHVDGTPLEYRNKVYGLGPNGPQFVSMANVQDGMVQAAWNLQKVYDRLWNNYGHAANKFNITPAWIDHFRNEFELIISAIPLPALCRSVAGEIPVKHEFLSQTIQVMDRCILNGAEEDTIHYNGTQDTSWYRCSRLFGHGGTEFPGEKKLPYKDVRPVTKPIRAICDCFPEVKKVGRYGTWRKGVLTHDAYYDTFDALQQLQEAR